MCTTTKPPTKPPIYQHTHTCTHSHRAKVRLPQVSGTGPDVDSTVPDARPAQLPAPTLRRGQHAGHIVASVMCGQLQPEGTTQNAARRVDVHGRRDDAGFVQLLDGLHDRRLQRQLLPLQLVQALL